MKYTGSCQCGAVKFEAEGTIESAVACNCSMCQRKGSLLWFIPRDKFRLLTQRESTSGYKFNKHIIDHRFCRTCGIHPFADGVDPKGNAIAAINIRCLEGVDLDAIPVKHFNGRAL